MYLWVILASVVVAWVRGGRIRDLANLPFRWEGLVVGAFVLRFGLQLAGSAGAALSEPVVWLVQAASYGMLLAAVAINRRVGGVPTIGLGVLANAVTILLNGGRMPVSPAAAAAVGQEAAVEYLLAGGSYLHQPLVETTRLPLLSDILPSPSWLPGQHVYSIGDVFILIGLFALIQHLAVRPPSAPATHPGSGVA